MRARRESGVRLRRRSTRRACRASRASSGAATAPSPTVASRMLSQHTEDACEHVLGRRALQQRHPGDVDDRVPDPDHCEQDERAAPRSARRRSARSARPRARCRDRNRRPCRRRPTSAAATHRADHPTDADRRVQKAHGRLARAEQLQRDDDDQDVEHPVDERLRGKETDEQPEATVSTDRPESGEQLSRTEPGSRVACSARSAPGARPRSGPPTRASAAAVTAKTVAVPSPRAAARRAPGHRRFRRSRSRSATTFAAVSSSGVRASVGSSAACAGRKAVATMPTSTARA